MYFLIKALFESLSAQETWWVSLHELDEQIVRRFEFIATSFTFDAHRFFVIKSKGT